MEVPPSVAAQNEKRILTKVKCWDNIIENVLEEYFEG
jgi:hypothetical protein